MESVQEILQGEGFESAQSLAENWALMVALSKVDEYRSEIERFEQKYAVTFEQYEQSILVEAEEDFEKEDDYEDWAFALPALQSWQGRVEKSRGEQFR